MSVEFITAFDGEKRLALLRSPVHLDLVISDISMPGMGGIGLFKTIQRDGELAKTPWMFTSSPDREYGVLEAGCAYFLGKPFSLGHLKRAVASTLDRSIINR